MKRVTAFLLTLMLLCGFQVPAGAAGGMADGRYGYINHDGEMVIEPRFDYAYAFRDGLALVFSGSMTGFGFPDKGKYWFIDEKGQRAINAQYDDARSFREGLSVVKKNGKYGVINTNGDVVIDFLYDEARNFQDGLSVVKKNGKYGVINTNGDVVIDFLYDEARNFQDGLSIVKKNGKYGVINTNGDVVIDFLYDDIRQGNTSFIAYSGEMTGSIFHEFGKHDVIAYDGSLLFSIECKSLYEHDGYYEAYDGDHYALVGSDGTIMTEYIFNYLFSAEDHIIRYHDDDYQYGYINDAGNILIEAQYDYAGSFCDGKAIVENDGVFFLIDQDGNVLVQYAADYVGSGIASGVTYAFEGTLNDYGSPDQGKFYLMDLNGNYISQGYDNMYSEAQQLWCVQDGSMLGTIDCAGNVVFPFMACDSLSLCGNDYVVEKKGLYALYGKDGVAKTDFLFDDIQATSDALIPVHWASDEPDFRKAKWGMSMEEVKAFEGDTPDYEGKPDGRNANYIGYDITLMGNDAIVAFYFGEDGLYAARYVWTEEHSNVNLYITDYQNVREQLTKKYGAPGYDEEYWDTASHKKNYAGNKADALSYGYLTYYTSYTTRRTTITMNMSADNYNISFILDYQSKTVKEPEEDYSDVF